MGIPGITGSFVAYPLSPLLLHLEVFGPSPKVCLLLVKWNCKVTNSLIETFVVMVFVARSKCLTSEIVGPPGSVHVGKFDMWGLGAFVIKDGFKISREFK